MHGCFVRAAVWFLTTRNDWQRYQTDCNDIRSVILTTAKPLRNTTAPRYYIGAVGLQKLFG